MARREAYGPAADDRDRDRCIWDHDLTLGHPNTFVYQDKQGFTHRVCRPCRNRRSREIYHRERNNHSS